MMLLPPVLVTLALVAAEPAKAEPAKTDPPKREGSVDWQGEIIKATGSGAPDMRSLSPAQARLGAEKAAQLDAFRNLIASRQGHPHLRQQDGGRGDGEGRGEGPGRRRGEGLQGGEEAVLQRSGRGDGRRGAAVGHRPGGARARYRPRRRARGQKATDGRYTALLVDARGLGMQPVLAPRLLDASGKVLYAAEMLGPEARKDAVPARYFKSLEQATHATGARRNSAAGQGAEGAGLGPGARGGRGPRARAARPRRSWSRAGWPSSHEERTSDGSAAPGSGPLAPALAAEKLPPVVTKEAEGEAAIVGGNVDRAAREAKEAALRSAVEQVAGVLVSSQSLAVNSQLVSDQVYAHSAGYVRSYEVLSQTTERNVVKVKVRAQVGTAELDRDLQAVQALVRRLQGRKLVILLQEQTIDEKGVTTTSGVTATVLTDAFKRDGWTVIDPSFAGGKGPGVVGGGAGRDRGQGDRHPEQGRLHPLRDGGLPRRAPGRGAGPAGRAALGLPAHRRLRPRRLRDLGRRRSWPRCPGSCGARCRT